MKMPTFEDLSKEQDAICVFASLDEATLVTGPPGTGKTVVAFYRAEAVSKKGHTPNVVMYNTVLRKYTSNAAASAAVQRKTKTFFSWLGSWWSGTFFEFYPQHGPFDPDWDTMIKQVLSLPDTPWRCQKAFQRWGHLVVDEGQDFPKGFYLMAQLILAIALRDGNSNVALTVLADDNQRLNVEQNSCIEEIVESLSIPDKRHYHLTRNYRNTYEIARVAAHFYCGLQTGIPELPEARHGKKPRVVRTKNIDDSVQVIKRFITNQSDLEFGVFLSRAKLQKRYFNKLQHHLKDVQGVHVQRYSSGDDDFDNANNLVFDKPGVVTVLCDQSAKGLEFDVVFIPELQARSWKPDAIDHMRMQFYVLASRARQHLMFLYSAEDGEEIPILDQLPNPETDLLEWVNG